MAASAVTRVDQSPISRPTLFLAFALSTSTWKLGCTTGAAQRPRERHVPARHLAAVQEEIPRATQRFGFPADAPVVCCYEAGRDGFWLHRWVGAQGVENLVVDSSSLAVQRRQRRAKTDRLAVHKFLMMLLRHVAGEKRVWSVVRVPSVEEDDRRQLHRALATAKRDRTRGMNRLKDLLAAQGLTMPPARDFLQQLEHLRLWDGSLLPSGLRQRLLHEWEDVEGVSRRMAPLEADRRTLIRAAEEGVLRTVQQLVTLKGIGTNSAWGFVRAFFGWRAFRNGKEVGALSGLTPTPYASGHTAYERGIAKAGNDYSRALAVEIAWGWLRFQPTSALSQWYQARVGQGRSRLRRMGIVA
jgi:transposase